MLVFDAERQELPMADDDIDLDELLEELGLNPNFLISHTGITCRYGHESHQAGTSQSTCGLIALNCARTIFGLAKEWGATSEQDLVFVKSLLSSRTTNDILSVGDQLLCNSQLDMDELLEVPVFYDAFSRAMPTTARSTYKGFMTLLERMWDIDPRRPIVAAVITHLSETVACLRIFIASTYTYIIFDPHSRPTYPCGPGFVFNKTREATASYLVDIFMDTSSGGDVPELQTFSAYILFDNMLVDLKHQSLKDSLDTTTSQSNPRKSISIADKSDKTVLPFLEVGHSSSQVTTSSTSSPVTPLRRSKSEFGWQLALQSGPAPAAIKEEAIETLDPEDDITSLRKPLQPNEELSNETQQTSSMQPPAKVKKYAKKDIGWQLALQRLEAENDVRIGDLQREWSKPILAEQRSTETIKAGPSRRRPAREDISWKLALAATSMTYPTSWLLDDDAETARVDGEWEQPPLEDTTPVVPPTSECGVCLEVYDKSQVARMPDCAHTFCRDCLKYHVESMIRERRFPILCPTCVLDRANTDPGSVNQKLVIELDVTQQNVDLFDALQLSAHSVELHCPRCKETMNVDRQEYLDSKILVCPLPPCGHKWCKACQKMIPSSLPEDKHACKADKLDRLMRKKGWRYCPGCTSVIQKESGCNHMTCTSPGCNMHFCYKCGAAIIDAATGRNVGEAVSAHYRTCTQFEPKYKCTIQ